MIRWNARVGDRVHHVEIDRREGGALTATVDGRVYKLNVNEPQPQVYSILSEEGSSDEAIVQVRQGRCRVRLGPRVFEVAAEEHSRADLAGGASARDAGGAAQIRAVMPGRVLRLMVEQGQRVSAKQGLVVLEAMKMENEVTAPRDGTVSHLKVSPGSTVESGDLLLVID